MEHLNGFLSNRISGRFLPIVYKLIGQNIAKAACITWRLMIQNMTGSDPIKCSNCGTLMVLKHIKPPISIAQLIIKHQKVAHGYYQLV